MNLSLLFKILKNWPNEPERPPLLLCNLAGEDWKNIRDQIISIFFNSKIDLNHPDLVQLEKDPKKQNIEVEQTRQFIGKLSLSTYEHPIKVGLIPCAHLLNIQSQNALLKTFEEPLSSRYLILGSISKNKLLPTIISRSTVINLISHKNTEIYDNQVNELEEIHKSIIKSDRAKRLYLGHKWTGGKNEKINQFFNFMIARLHLELKESLLKRNISKCKKITGLINTALNYYEQMGRTSGASPKLLFESFLLKM